MGVGIRDPAHGRHVGLGVGLLFEVLMPRGGIEIPAMKNLAPADHVIVVRLEMLRQRHSVRQDRPPGLAVEVHAGRGRPNPAQQARPGRVAGRGRTIRTREQRPPLGQAIQIGRPHAGVAPEHADPIVEIVDGQEQHVRPVIRLRGWRGCGIALGRCMRRGC